MKYANFPNLIEELSTHEEELRVRRFIRNGEFPSLTNFSLAELRAGQKVETHSHETMNEFFYVLSGEGIMKVDGKILNLFEGLAVAVCAKENHSLEAVSDLKLLYFGTET